MDAERIIDDQTAPRGSTGTACIRIFGDRVFLAHPVPGAGSLTIGRSDDCDLVINEHSVSRMHAKLHFGRGVTVEDIGSSNGTRVGASQLRAGERCPLPPGQVAELGRVLVTVDAIRSQDPAETAQARISAALAEPPQLAGAGAGEIVVLDEAMVVLHRLVERVAGGEISVLLTGETGAGKEVLAERIHRCSPRRDKPFLRLNCAALVEPLLESELFGHDKGAFTGATRAKPGLLEATAGGTVFLDEIGEMPLALQAKLLRVLDERQVRPVGSLTASPIDVRFVAATNRALEDEIARGRFRQDLFFRLSGVVLAIPALRERPREILALAESFVVRAAQAMGVAVPRLGSAARTALVHHSWPGNVRELKNVIERAVLLAGGDQLGVAELQLPGTRPSAPSPIRPIAIAAAPAADQPVPDEAVLAGGSLQDQLEAVERRRILDTLETCGGNRSEAARRLGISRNTLLTRLDRYGASRHRR